MSFNFEDQLKVFAMVIKSPRINLEDVDDEGNTLFHVAFKTKDAEIVEVLIKEAINRNIAPSLSVTKNSFGLTAIHCAFNYFNEIIFGRESPILSKIIDVILKYSKEAKINLEARCSKGKTPLHYLFETKNEVNVAALLE